MFPSLLAFKELDDDDFQSLAAGPDGLSQGGGRLALAVAGVNLYQPFKLCFCHADLPG